MVLHARTPADVTDYQDLNVLILGVLGRTVAGWDGVGQGLRGPEEEPEAIVEDDHGDGSGDDGEDEGKHRGG